MRLGRDSFYAVWDQQADDALRLLHAALTITSATDDTAEGIAAFRREARAALDGPMIHYDIRGPIAAIVIDRPERRNALDREALAGLEQALEQAKADDARVIVLKGTAGHFCAGADLTGVEDTGSGRRVRAGAAPGVARFARRGRSHDGRHRGRRARCRHAARGGL